MMEVEGMIAAGAAAEASKGIFGFVKQQVDYCIHFRTYVEDLKWELETLKATLEDAENLEERARNNNEEISKVGKRWLESARILKDKAEKLKKKAEEQTKCLIGLCPNCICRSVIGKKAADMTPELKRTYEDFKSENFSQAAPHPGMEFYAPMNFVDLASRKAAYDQVWKALHDDQMLRIGVYALGGLGKTTLVKELGYKAENEKWFHKVVFVVVSKPVDVGRIQDNIASQLDLKFKNNQVSDRAVELWQRLKQEEILIILDDVWEELDLEAIGIRLGEMHKGIKLLLTTRSFGLCTSMECQATIPLSLLSEDDSLKLFEKYANISNHLTVHVDLAKEITNECRGLPVAITTVARTLKGKEPRKWEDALKALKDAKPLTGIPVHLKDFYNSFSFCFADLESKESQELLLLCSFFPEDYRIPIEILTRYAIGLGLFKYDGSYEDIRDWVKEAIKELDFRLLLHANKDVYGEYVKMHDLVHEAAQWIKNTDNMEIMGSKINEEAMNRARYLWLYGTNDLPTRLNFPKHEILMIAVETKGFVDYFEENEELFKELENLRVLVLTTEFFWDGNFRIKLPQPIQLLKNLRMLRLKGWKLGDISVIGSIKNLEGIELCACEIDELPSGMVELKNLRLLDLSDCEILKDPYKILVRLKQLKELYFFSYSLWNVDLEDISNYFGEKCQLTELTRYRIQIGEFFGRFPEHLICLSISRFHPFTSSATIKMLVRRAEHLCLQDIQGDCKNIMPDVVRAVGGKIQWSHLFLRYCKGIDFLIANASSENACILSALVELSVSDMEDLKELCHGTTPSGFLEKLEKLSVNGCAKLQSTLLERNLNLRNLKVVEVRSCFNLPSLFTLSVAISLVQLEELLIQSCDGLKHIIADGKEWEDDEYSQKISSASIFQNLKSVEIWWCDSLEFIFPVCLAGRLVQLEKIHIRYAYELKHIFGQYQVEGRPLHQNDKEIILPSLQKIELIQTQNFNSIFPIYYHPKDCPQVEASGLEATTLMESHLSKNQAATWYTCAAQCLPRKLLKCCSVRDSAHLDATAMDATTSMHLCMSRNTDTRLFPQVYTVQYYLPRQLLSMCHVREMYLDNLPATVVSLFTLSTAQKMMLKDLKIYRCHGLKHIITNGEEVDFDKSYVSVFPKLQHLYIQDCQQLEFIFPACLPQRLAKLETLTIIGALGLKSMFGQCYHNNHLSDQNENVIHMELPSLKELCLINCPQLRIKATDDFVICSYAREPDCKTRKAILRHDNVLNIKKLHFKGIRMEGIFQIEGFLMNEKDLQLTSMLEELTLLDQPELKYICMGPVQYCLSFENLRHLVVDGCGILSCIFSVSVQKSFPQLTKLTITDCNELEEIIEKDEDDNVYFPNLTAIRIRQCNKLKYLFFISQFNQFPELNYLYIEEAPQLEKVFRWRTGEARDKNNTLLMKLTMLRLRNLRSLTNVSEGFSVKTVNELEVKGCPKVPLEYRNDERINEVQEIIEKEVIMDNRDDTYLPTVSPPSLTKINAIQQNEGVLDSESVEGKEARLEEIEHEGGKKGEEVVIEKPRTSSNNKKSHMAEKENPDAAPRTSSDFPSNNSDEAPKELYPLAAPQTANMNEKIQESSDQPLVFPTSSNFLSNTSGDARKESSTSDTQYNRTPIEEAEEMVQKCQIPAKPAKGEFTDGQTETSVTSPLIVSLNPHEYQNAGDAREDSSTLSTQYFGIPIEEEEIVQKSPMSAKPAMVTSSTESEIRRPSPNAMLTHAFVDDASLPEPVASDSAESNTIDMKKIRDTAPQTSGESSKALSPPVPEPPIAPSTSQLSSISPHPIHESPPVDKLLSSSVSQYMVNPGEEYAAFRDIGPMKKKHIPLLEQAIVKHPSLWAWRYKYRRPQMKQFGYATLGDMLEFLTTTRWRDLIEEKKAEFESLKMELEAFGFDIQWLKNTETRIKQSNIEEDINCINTLKVQEMKQKIAVEALEDSLQKAKRELENTTSEMETIKFKLGDLDDLIGF
ncbi:hypothetical protein L6164_024016 [Bauhinia variegata]|uniref:Uncharacterized protein n=1 Tax=Bauhinia variegata TaxID=167791 RepID=A0ACB9LWG5_BAUVA|nr:hypothetical protein L6164_024016 [Bauhinia variegata]